MSFNLKHNIVGGRNKRSYFLCIVALKLSSCNMAGVLDALASYVTDMLTKMASKEVLWGEPGVTHNPDNPPFACVNKLEDSFNQ
jgi:hypothetical protein